MIESRYLVIGAAVLLGVALLSMFAAHETHYKRRELQLLAGRIRTLEEIITGGHDV